MFTWADYEKNLISTGGRYTSSHVSKHNAAVRDSYNKYMSAGRSRTSAPSNQIQKLLENMEMQGEFLLQPRGPAAQSAPVAPNAAASTAPEMGARPPSSEYGFVDDPLFSSTPNPPNPRRFSPGGGGLPRGGFSFMNRQLNTPNYDFDGNHGELRLRGQRRRTNKLLDILTNRPTQYNKINEYIGGGLSNLLFANDKPKLIEGLAAQTYSGGQ